MTDRVESVRSIMSQGISVIRIPSAGGPQETVCLPLDLLNGFLFGIDENRVKDPAARERLIVYKRHGFRALFEYFNPSAAGVEPPRAAPETHLFDDVPLREAMVKLSTLRETRLLWGRDAARRIWAMLGMPDVATPGDSARGPAATAAEPSLEAFLSDCFEVTGNPRDRVYPPEMWQRYQDWAEAVCAPPLGHRTFSLRLAALVANWRCPRTGRRISRMKSGTTLYSGLRPMDVTP